MISTYLGVIIDSIYVGLRGMPHAESKRKGLGNLYVGVIRALAWSVFKE